MKPFLDSGEGAAQAHVAPLPLSPEMSSGRAVLLPHEGHVLVGWDADLQEYMLVHEITCERVRLGREITQAHLEYDEAGEGVVVLVTTDDEVRHEPVDALLSIGLYKAVDGALYLADDTAEVHQLVALEEAQSSFEQFIVALPGWELQQNALSCARFGFPGFSGSQLRWGLHQLYNVLSMRSHLGHRWTWVSKNVGSWLENLRKCWPRSPQPICRAQAVARFGRIIPENESPLTWASVDTAGLLALVLRFGYSKNSQTGLLTKADSQHASRVLLSYLLDLLPAEFSITILLDVKVAASLKSFTTMLHNSLLSLLSLLEDCGC